MILLREYKRRTKEKGIRKETTSKDEDGKELATLGLRECRKGMGARCVLYVCCKFVLMIIM